MAFDRNPKSNAADVFIAGKTTEYVISAIIAGNLPAGVTTLDALLALQARFDRKAAARAEKAAA